MTRRDEERRQEEQPVPVERRSRPQRMVDVEREWLSISAYAVKYGVNRRTVYKWMAAGVLDTFKVGFVVRVRDQPPGAHAPCA